MRPIDAPQAPPSRDPLPGVDPVLGEVLAAYGLPAGRAHVERAPSGLIQQTWLVTLGPDAASRRLVVQRMHPIFGPEVLDDIDVVTAHLAAAGLATPRPLRTPDGRLSVADGDARCWRVLSYVDGVTFDRAPRPAAAEAAGHLVARFHRAVADLDHQFRFVRAGVHDTAAHLARLEAVLGAAPLADADQARLAPLAQEILAEAGRLPPLAALPRRITHGDLKLSNVVFADASASEARALIDLDTLGRLSLAYELGDAWRSWCNPLGEDVEDARFDLEVFAAGVAGYARGAHSLLAREEAEALVPGVITVCVELAARFCVDAFEDRYFGWDPARFPSRREHNRVRATGQLGLARSVLAARSAAETVVHREFLSRIPPPIHP